MRWRLPCLLTVLLLPAGCARLDLAAKTPGKLPPARLSPDAVVLDMAFVRLPAADQERYDSIWTAADEQVFSPELRRELATNGLRVGVFGQQLPTSVRELVDAKQTALDERSEDLDAGDVEVRGGNRHLQVRAGRRTKILASKTYPALAVLLNEDGQVRGHHFNQAQCVLALKPYPQGDGRVKLDLTPEIEHGELKSQWARGEGMLMQRLGRERLVLDRLRLEALLSPGEWLVLSSSAEIKGLGQYFFAETAGGTVERTMVLVRLSQTQLDDLFAPAQTSATLATPGE
jgi:hypothetical protein